MAKLVLNPIGSFSQSAITAINVNMDRIEDALEKTLSRDGTSPNQMGADLDLNHNDILNVATISADVGVFDNLTIEDVDLNTIVAEVEADADRAEAAADRAEEVGNLSIEAYTNWLASAPTSVTVLHNSVANGVSTTFTLSDPAEFAQINVYFSGVLQRKDGVDYTISGTTLTPGSLLATGTTVYVERAGTFGLPAVPGGYFASVADAFEGTRTNLLMSPYVAKKHKWEEPGTVHNLMGFFGSTGDQDDDNTPAFENMYEFYNNISNNIYLSNFADYSIPSVFSIAAIPQTFVPAGIHRYSGSEFLIDGPNFRGFSMLGEGNEASTIVIDSDVEFLHFPQDGAGIKYSVSFESLKFIGGKRIYANRRTLAIPQGFTRAVNCVFAGQTKGVFASSWGDDPSWFMKNNLFYGSREDATSVALTIPRVAAGVDISGNAIVGYSYGLKVLGGDAAFQANFSINDNMFFALSATGYHKADIWFVPGEAGVVQMAPGASFRRNRFSNEFLYNPRVLIAKEDKTTGADELDWTHSTAISTGQVHGFIFEENNCNGGGGTADTNPNNEPFIKSYTSRISGATIQNNTSTGWSRAWLEFAPGVGQIKSELINNILIDSNNQLDYGEPWPDVAHKTVVGGAPAGLQHASPQGSERGGRGQIYSPAVPISQDFRYRDINDTAKIDGNALLTIGSVGKTSVTDYLGGSTAGEFTFTSTNVNSTHIAWILGAGGTSVAGLGAGDVVFIEWLMKEGTVNPMSLASGRVTVTYASGDAATFRETFPLNSELMLRRMIIPLADTPSSIVWRIPPTFVTLGSADRVVVDKFRAYRANQWIQW